MKKEVKIEIPNGYEIDKENSTFEKIVFKEIKHKVYDNFDEYFSSLISDEIKEYYDKFQDAENTLFELLVMRDHYREVLEDGWKPNWNDGSWIKCITLFQSEWRIYEWYNQNKMFAFRDEETAERFLKNFKDDLEKIKYLWE